MVVLTGGVEDVLDESSSLSRLKWRRTSETNSGGKSNNTLALSIINETIWAKDEAFVVRSSADIYKKLLWSLWSSKVDGMTMYTFRGHNMCGARTIPRFMAFILLVSSFKETSCNILRSRRRMAAFSFGKRRTSNWHPLICLSWWLSSARNELIIRFYINWKKQQLLTGKAAMEWIIAFN